MTKDGPPDRAAGAPVSPPERILALDVLRGCALLGILAVNIDYFAGPEGPHDVPVGLTIPAFVGWPAGLDAFTLWIKWLFLEGRMRALFAMLYGAGCVLLLERLEARVGRARSRGIFLRRNGWLLLFGLVHGMLIWDGDILAYYASCALLAPLLIHRLGAAKLMALGLAAWLATGIMGYLPPAGPGAPSARANHGAAARAVARFAAPHTAAEEARYLAADRADLARLHRQALSDAAARRSTSYLRSVVPQATDYLATYAGVVKSGRMLEILGAIVFGMGLYKTGFLSGRLRARTYWRIAAAGYALSIPIVAVGLWQDGRHGFSPQSTLFWLALPYFFQQVPGALANAAALLACVKLDRLRPVFRPLAAIGRTAFSNYILTSLICQFIFVWGPVRLYGRLEYHQYMYVVAAVWAVNLIASPLWLGHFTFGPLEWLWRTLTYARPARLRRTA